MRYLSTSLLDNQKAIQLLIAEGDEKAFALLFRHYYPLLRPAVAGYALTDTDIEEILQETFIRIWIHRDKLPEIENLDGWVFRVASRECLSMLRKNLQNRRHLNLLQKNNTSFIEDETPVDQVCLSEISRLVQEAVDRMPPQRKRIYQMSRIEGMKPAEIAAALSLSVSTVKNVLTTSLKGIRDHLVAEGLPLLLISIFFWIS